MLFQGFFSALIASFACLGATQALAQSEFPNRPIRLVVGFAAGGPTDVIARVIGSKMGDLLGQPVIVENRTGASGNIATQAVARSPSDGYTILLAPNAAAVNESLFKNPGVRLTEDLVPISSLAEAPTVLVVHPSLDVKSVSELINLAKAKPGEVFFATAGPGTVPHLAGELFNLMAGVKLVPVPYRGAGDTTKDLISGQIKVMFSPAPPVLGLIKSGQLRGIASTGPRRAAVAPDLPTVSEAGLPGFDMRMWFGLLAPAGTSPLVVTKLADAVKGAVASQEVKQTLEAQGFDPLPGTPEQFGVFVRSEIDKWRKVIQTVGIEAQ